MEKKNWWRVLLYFLIALMLGWFAYLSIALKVGCGILFGKGHGDIILNYNVISPCKGLGF